MSTTYYHADRLGKCSTDDTLELETNLHVPGQGDLQLPSRTEEALFEEFPEGLSAHGNRYFAQKYGSLNIAEEFGSEFPDLEVLYSGWDLPGGTNTSPVTTTFYECVFELVRQSEFPETLSRGQAYFACETKEDAMRWAREYGDTAQIIEVTCDGASRYDQDWLQVPDLPTGIQNARRYWEGEERTDDPATEVMMTPPVEIHDIVAEVNSGSTHR